MDWICEISIYIARIPKKEDEQKTDYITLLKLMVLIVTKINDEFCTLNFERASISRI